MTSETSVVREAASSARRAVLVALGGALVVVLGLALNQSFVRSAEQAAMARVIEAHEAHDKVLSALNKMLRFVDLAAGTGEESWLAKYLEQSPILDTALAEVTRVADGGASHALGEELNAARLALTELDHDTFRLVRDGALTAAQARLSDYDARAEHLADRIERFMIETIEAADRTSRQNEAQYRLTLSVLLPLSIVAAMTLWRHLNSSLSRSESAHLAAESRIRRLAMKDVLTGLANRISIRDGLRQAMEQAAAEKSKVAVLMIDLDRFKPVNDRHGHLVGDLVLKEVAKRLGDIVRSDELCGRFGGDEFVAVVEYGKDDEIPRNIGRRIVENLSETMMLQGATVDIGASVGLAVFPTDATEEDDLMSKADLALYKAKAAGRGTVRWFDASMDVDLRMRAELESSLGSAIRNGEIVPYYQPIVDLASGHLAGFEVLARWHRPAGGTVPPSDFIPIAEQTGLIDELMLSVLQRACLDMRALPSSLTISINVAPSQIQDERLAHRILAVLCRTGFSPKRLEVELTETALVNDIEAAKRVVASLKSLGITIALDDFGTGYSSLSYLSDLPFDKIKIDRAFIKTLHDRHESFKIVSSIIGLGRSLGAYTVAEGVETQRDQDALRAMRCSLAQGHFYSKPVPTVELQGLIHQLAAPDIIAQSSWPPVRGGLRS